MVDSSSLRELEIEELLGNTNWLKELARSLVGDAFTAEDLMQEALSHAKKDSEWATGHLGGWVAGIVRNLAKQHFRGESRRIAREQQAAYLQAQELAPETGMDHAPDPALLAQRVEMQHVLAEILLGLDETSKEVLLLRFYGNRSVKQIAEQLDLNLRAVETRLRRAKLRLRERLEEQLGRGQWALACVPWLPRKMAPPPAAPPNWFSPIVCLAAGALLLSAVSLGWMPWQQGADSLQPRKETQAMAPGEATPAPANAGKLEREPLPVLPIQDEASARVFRLRFVDRASGLGMPGLAPMLYAVRLASAAEEAGKDDPRFLRVKDRAFWVLEQPAFTTDEAGEIDFPLPEGCTDIVIDLALHTATHSVADYARGYQVYSWALLDAPEQTLEMVQRHGVATGRVARPGGEAVPYAKVDLVPTMMIPRPPSVAKTVEADSGGFFRMEHVASDVGGFSLIPHLPGYLPSRQLVINNYAGPDYDFEEIELHLVAANRVRVVVQDGLGVPISGATVEASASVGAENLRAYPFGGYQSTWISAARTDELGTALVAAPAQGGADWLVMASGFSPWEQSLDGAPAVLPVTLQQGNDVRIQVLSQGNPVADGAIRMVRKKDLEKGVKGPVVTSDAKGMGVFFGAPVGEVVEFTVYAAGHQAFLSQPTEVLGRAQNLSVNLEPGLGVSGKVVDWQEEYSGIARPNVFLLPVEAQGWPWEGDIPADQRPYFAWELAGLDQQRIDPEGSFAFEGLAPGRYRLWFGKRLIPRGMVEVNAGEEGVVLSPSSQEAAAPVFSGVVLDAESMQPLSVYRLMLTTYSAAGERLKTSRGQRRAPLRLVKSEDGRFRLKTFRPGFYSLSVWAPNDGYASYETAPRYFAAGEHELSFLIAKASSLKLQLQNQSGEALEGVKVRALLPDGARLLQAGEDAATFLEWNKSLAEGRVEIGSIPAVGEFQLEFRFDGKSTFRSGADLRDGSHGQLVTVVL